MMKYIIGVDGGGTKTQCALADETGQVHCVVQTGCSNHQLCGLKGAVKAISEGVGMLLSRFSLELKNISYITLGLAGADFDSDIEMLSGGLGKALPGVSIEVMTDVWLPLSAAAKEGYGAVSICGTGHNTAVMTEEGARFGISALTYPLGNFGGGRMLTQMALHAAFRAHEGTGESTLLVERLPGAFGESSMGSLLYRLYTQGEKLAMEMPIPQLVYELAAQGDAVCLSMIRTLGRTQGRMTGGLIHRAGLEAYPLPVVLAGSLYQNDHNGLLVAAYQEGIVPYCPNCRISKMNGEPVVGAVMLALRQLYREKKILSLGEEQLLRAQKTFSRCIA